MDNEATISDEVRENETWANNDPIIVAPDVTEPVDDAPEVEQTRRKTVVELAQEVNDKVWGAREQTQRKRLYKAGYNATSVLAEAERQANPDGPHKSISLLADEVIAGDWGEGYEQGLRLRAAGYSAQSVSAEVSRRQNS